MLGLEEKPFLVDSTVGKANMLSHHSFSQVIQAIFPQFERSSTPFAGPHRFASRNETMGAANPVFGTDRAGRTTLAFA